MSSTRDYTIRRTTKSQEMCQAEMEYPYGYIGQEYCTYDLHDILRSILVEADQADAGDFPHNIQEHFFVQCGERDGDNWISCGLLTNGNYFFYTGGCDYTGFDCQGGMSLWVSNSWKNIVDNAMSQSDYDLYIHQDEPRPQVQEEEEEDICPKCEVEAATMPNEFDDECERICPECFWTLDADMKRQRRADPEWRYARAFSAAKTLFNKSDEEAHEMAKAAAANV